MKKWQDDPEHGCRIKKGCPIFPGSPKKRKADLLFCRPYQVVNMFSSISTATELVFINAANRPRVTGNWVST